jgi:hypothetical protein
MNIFHFQDKTIFFYDTRLMIGDPDRGFTTCIIESPLHNFYSGVAVVTKDEPKNQRMGRRIALYRAVGVMYSYLENPEAVARRIWSEILRQEREANRGEA